MTVSTAEDRSRWLHGGGKKDFGMLTRGRSKCQRASQVQALNRSRWPRVVSITSISLGLVTVRRPIVSHIRHTALQTQESKAY